MGPREICNNTGHGDSTKACTLWHTGFPIDSCVLLMNYRTERSVFFGFHICDHVFSYLSDYSVVISSACPVLSVDRRQLHEEEKHLVACITKCGACNLNSLFWIPCPENKLLRQGISKPILSADSDNFKNQFLELELEPSLSDRYKIFTKLTIDWNLSKCRF